ncbi:hypothetical protein PspLS_04098 [Pyricularia sp. CBS 133598]|nr:hypothetical protein PspLS_04098 [Pyricularia sp. CBS 133598]
MSTLATLAPELLLQIFAPLDLRAQIRLSSTCSRLRHLGVNEVRIFETLSFTWAKKHVADSALLVAQTYGDMVRTLRVIHRSPPCFYPADGAVYKCDHGKLGPELPMMPASFITLLSGRGSDGPLLPRVESLTIEFPAIYPDEQERPFECGEIEWKVRTLYDDYSEEDEHPIGCNNVYIDAMLQVLVDSQYAESTAIKSLRLANLPPHSSVFFDSTNWRCFLGGLNHLDLSLYGWGDSSDLTTINRQVLYLSFVDELDKIIFNHLPRLTKLGFHISKWATLDEPLPWEPTVTPLLEELELANVDVNANLLSFLTSWSKTINRPVSLTLNCAAADSRLRWDDPEYLTWAAFFDGLSAGKIGFSKFEMTMREVDMGDASPDFTDRMAANPGLLVFSYGQIDEKHKDWMDDPEMTMEMFLLGRDQASYDIFMAKVGSEKPGEDWNTSTYALLVLTVTDGAADVMAVEVAATVWDVGVCVEEEALLLLVVWVLDEVEELGVAEVVASNIVNTLTVGNLCVLAEVGLAEELAMVVDVDVEEELDEELDKELKELDDVDEEEDDKELVVAVTDVDEVDELEVVEDDVVRLVAKVELVDAPRTVADLEVDDVETASQLPKRAWQPVPQ